MEARAVDQLGLKAAAALRNRLSDLRAAEVVSDVLAGNPVRVVIDGLACYLIDLGDGCMVTVACNQPSAKVDGNGNVDWSRVRRIKVLSMGRS